jgi:predicted amidohydrolase
MGDNVKVALVQLLVGTDKLANISHAKAEVNKAADGGAQLGTSFGFHH